MGGIGSSAKIKSCDLKVGGSESDPLEAHASLYPKTEARSLFVGVDLGGTKIYAGLADEKGGFRAKVRELSATSEEELAEQLPRVVERLLKEAGSRKEEIAAVGVGSPGPLDPDSGIVITTPNMPFRGFPLVKIMENRLGIPTFLDNDVNVCTLGEALLGAGMGKDSVVGIFVGTGIGGGIVLGGKVYHGASKNAGEIGHMVIQMDGPVCGCGGRGHLEALASKTAMAKRFEAAKAEGRGSMLFELSEGPYDKLQPIILRKCWEANDGLVREVLLAAAHALAVGCVSLIHVLGPDAIILGGGVIEAVGEFLLPLIRKETFESCVKGTFEHTQILPSALGDDAGIFGALALAKSRLSQQSASKLD